MLSRFPIAGFLCALLGTGVGSAQAKALTTRPVPLMTLELRLDGTKLYKTIFPVDRAKHGAVMEKPQKTFSFLFKPMNAIVWMRGSGVLVQPVKTKPDQEVECSIQIFRPAPDSSWFTVGMSFYSEEKILLHTIHIARPRKRDRSEIATTGITISTYPARH